VVLLAQAWIKDAARDVTAPQADSVLRSHREPDRGDRRAGDRARFSVHRAFEVPLMPLPSAWR
jgi:hypothetical protein